MFRSKPPAPLPVKRVWRISQSDPLGQWVDVVTPVAAKPVAKPKPGPGDELPEVSYGSWVTSSYDLLDGSDVIEDPDTVPGDLFDELFHFRLDPPKRTGE